MGRDGGTDKGKIARHQHQHLSDLLQWEGGERGIASQLLGWVWTRGGWANGTVVAGWGADVVVIEAGGSVERFDYFDVVR